MFPLDIFATIFSSKAINVSTFSLLYITILGTNLTIVEYMSNSILSKDKLISTINIIFSFLSFAFINSTIDVVPMALEAIFLDVYYTFLLGDFDYTNIDNNRIKIGTCTMTDDNHIINTYSSIPVVYQIENSNVKYNGNLKIEYDETNNGRNNIELVINTEDVQTIKNKKVEQIEGRTLMIEIIGGGIFNDNIYIP